ncbi:hypothetical protein GL218_05905 [Daldinia childiae]|uniref:uncharacterized protein n=1 Tax=Daldinia childiae TaxID=326645 RepID=UPI0014471B3B|nr:uncharacterized protein GL218_05905 [Daldinia childiae]KAF3058216.1 hypothetical protein GL218_05905 [Daldinia childiae]
MLLSRVRIAPTYRTLLSYRSVSTLSTNSYIKVFPNASVDNGHLLTYLDTNPPKHRLAIGSTTALPPTPNSFSENREFLSILTDVLRKHAAQDPGLLSQAQAFAGPGGATLGSGGAFFPQQRKHRNTRGTAAGLGGGGGAGGGGAGGASAQGGAGGAGVGGHIHLSDLRNPPDYGRIAWPEDILGSIEVDRSGNIIGEFEPSGTYRIITNEGILGLSDFLRTKLVERLKEEEKRL